MLDIIKNRYIYIWVSFVVLLFSLFMIIYKNKNLWIDMTWWTQSEFSYSWTIKIDELSKILENLKEEYNKNNSNIINAISVYRVSWEKKIIVETWFWVELDENTLEAKKAEFNNLVLSNLQKINSSLIQNKYINIWKSFWDYIKKTAFLTLWIALVAISLYIAFAFFWVAIW